MSSRNLESAPSSEKCSILPSLPRQDLIQIYIFLFLFTIIGFALVGGWLSATFQINNSILLIICTFTIAFNDNVNLCFLFGYSLMISAFLDILAISFNWSGGKWFINYIGLVLAILLMIAKIVLSVNQIQYAKNINGEVPLKINFDRIFNAQASRKEENSEDIEKHPASYQSGLSLHKSQQKLNVSKTQIQEVETL